MTLNKHSFIIASIVAICSLALSACGVQTAPTPSNIPTYKAGSNYCGDIIESKGAFGIRHYQFNSYLSFPKFVFSATQLLFILLITPE